MSDPEYEQVGWEWLDHHTACLQNDDYDLPDDPADMPLYRRVAPSRSLPLGLEQDGWLDRDDLRPWHRQHCRCAHAAEVHVPSNAVYRLADQDGHR